MRRPADFQTSLNGLYAAMAMTGAQMTMDGIRSAVNYVNWWPFQGVVNSFLDTLNWLLQWFTNQIFPGAPGALDYFTSAPEDMVYLAGDIYDTLAFFHAQRRYIQYTLIPQQAAFDQGLSWALYYQGRAYATMLYNWAISALTGEINSVYGYIYQVTGWLTAQIQTDLNEALFYAKGLYDSAIQQLVSVMVQLESRMDAEYRAALAFATRVRDDLTTALNVAKVELTAAIAALSLWLTTVYIPGALTAYTELTIAQIAAGMDLTWPLVARSITQAATRLAVSSPLVAARALDVPPEPVPGIGGLAEAATAALAFVAAVQADVTLPLDANLRQFGKETSELGGVIGTMLIGGLAVAAVTAPRETATVVADALANPMNDVLTGALDLLGLGA
jgi:hypothetical protein